MFNALGAYVRRPSSFFVCSRRGALDGGLVCGWCPHGHRRAELTITAAASLRLAPARVGSASAAAMAARRAGTSAQRPPHGDRGACDLVASGDTTSSCDRLDSKRPGDRPRRRHAHRRSHGLQRPPGNRGAPTTHGLRQHANLMRRRLLAPRRPHEHRRPRGLRRSGGAPTIMASVKTPPS